MAIRKTLNVLLLNIVLAVAVSAGLIFLLLHQLDRYTHHGQQVAVPDVRGLQVGEAEPTLRQLGLDYTVSDSVYLKDITPGSIYETFPPAGTNVKKERTIYLTVNAFSANKSIVPAVVDLSQRQAKALLEAQGFDNVQVRTVPGAYKNLVVGLLDNRGDTIASGAKLTANSRLYLLVGSGVKAEEPEEDSVTTAVSHPNESWF
jgi:beta-lactam-binding protein with PASTA domain